MHGRKSLSPGIRFMDFTRFTEFLYLRKMASNSSQWSRQGDFLESPRWLPTDHDCAVSTRGYQSDQPSHLAISLSPALHPPRLIQNLVRRRKPLKQAPDKVAPYQKINLKPI